jgi:hypothetical protein
MKGKISLCLINYVVTRHETVGGSGGIHLHVSCSQHYTEMSGRLKAPAVFPQGKQHPGGEHSHSGPY